MKKKVERNKKLYEYYLRESNKHGVTYDDVAKVFQLSPSRVCRIVKSEEKRRVSCVRKIVKIGAWLLDRDYLKSYAEVNKIPFEKLEDWLNSTEKEIHCVFCSEHYPASIGVCPRCHEYKGLEPCLKNGLKQCQLDAGWEKHND